MVIFKKLGDVLTVLDSARRPIKSNERIPGKTPYLGASGVVDFVEGRTHEGPLLCLAEDGENLQSRLLPVAWCQDGEFWANNHVHVLGGVSRNRLKFFEYAILNTDLSGYITGSAQPKLSQQAMRDITVPDFGFDEEERIGEFFGALDDKIAANQRVVNSITDLQSAIWNRAIKDVERVPVESVALPQLGGTPARKVQENWTNEIPWSSVADMTAANGKYLLSTAEGISTECAKTRRFAPLPAGAVLLSARGTVGKVVTLVSPTSFNQSAYGFAEPENRSAALRLAIEGIVEELRSKSYGSVFSTITKGTILECTVPNVFHEEYFDLHSHLGMLEDRAISAVKENQALARTRDELLPLLMNGKITVAEAKEAAGDVDVVKQNKQEEGDGSV